VLQVGTWNALEPSRVLVVLLLVGAPWDLVPQAAAAPSLCMQLEACAKTNSFVHSPCQ
jgi:hypothetical protein